MAVRPNNKEWKAAKEKNPDTVVIPLPEMTAKKRSQMPDFIAACDEAGIKPTKRQGAKYNAGYGRWSKTHNRVLN